MVLTGKGGLTKVKTPATCLSQGKLAVEMPGGEGPFCSGIQFGDVEWSKMADSKMADSAAAPKLELVKTSNQNRTPGKKIFGKVLKKEWRSLSQGPVRVTGLLGGGPKIKGKSRNDIILELALGKKAPSTQQPRQPNEPPQDSPAPSISESLDQRLIAYSEETSDVPSVSGIT